MTGRRLYGPIVLGTLAAGGLAFFALGRTWASSNVVAEGLTADRVAATGTDAHPLGAALAVVVVASSLAILAASRRVRQTVGGFTALVALVGIWVIVFNGDAPDGAITAAVEKSPAFTGSNHPDALQETAWSYVALAGFVVAALLGALTMRFAPSWPTMGSRYDAPPVRSSAQQTQDDNDMWKALDEGRDPTQ